MMHMQNRIERRRPFEAREIQEYQPAADSPIDASSSTPHDHGSDVGILSTVLKGQDSYADFYEGSRVLQSPPQDEECTDGFVHCENGYEVGTDKTCEVACGNTVNDTLSYGGECCSGKISRFVRESPCYRFTGSVCRDGSCSGGEACSKAKITSVVRSCNGDRACENAANDGGSIEGGITDSCNGDKSCKAAAANRGSIAAITKGCIGEDACFGAALRGGSIGGIYKACIGTNACDGIAGGSGSIAAITKACKGDRACQSVAARTDYFPDPPENGSSIGGVGIYKACNADEACSDLALVQLKNCTGPQFPPFCPKFRNCTEGAQQVAPYCPSYCPRDIRFSNLTAYEECLDTYECFPSNFGGPRNCYNCTGLQEDHFCPLDFNCTGPLVYPKCPNSDTPIYYDITDGLEKCCNKESSCKDIRTQDELSDKCTPKDKKNAPWKKGKGGD